MVRNIENATHYTWGDSCDGWHLLDTNSLSVIQERMPPGTEEVYHYHEKAQQVFYILSGTASFDIDGVQIEAKHGDSIHVMPGKHHKIKNESAADLHFLVISAPKVHGDRVVV